ncbi:unnamed protein product, partial [marine sediment metagenome]
MPYIPKSKFISLDPERREKQLANLIQNRLRRSKTPAIAPLKLNDPEYKTDIIKFGNEQFYIPETKSPI